MSPEGWVRFVIVTLDLCMYVFLSICCCHFQKSPHPLGASSQRFPVSFWKFCKCTGTCKGALFEKKRLLVSSHNWEIRQKTFLLIFQVRPWQDQAHVELWVSPIVFCVCVCGGGLLGLCQSLSHALNLWGFVQKDISDSLIQSAEPKLRNHDG